MGKSGWFSGEDFPLSQPIELCTLWLFNIAMENGPVMDDFPAINLHLWWIVHGYVKSPDGKRQTT